MDQDHRATRDVMFGVFDISQAQKGSKVSHFTWHARVPPHVALTGAKTLILRYVLATNSVIFIA